ncbi:MAG: hypothetical protein II668_04505 [Oscillospiraceae bacterium]|nr:hypothetical protein [Oscillospiraceae bacterium]
MPIHIESLNGDVARICSSTGICGVALHIALRGEKVETSFNLIEIKAVFLAAARQPKNMAFMTIPFDGHFVP